MVVQYLSLKMHVPVECISKKCSNRCSLTSDSKRFTYNALLLLQITLDLYLLTTFPTMGPIDLLEAKMPTSPLSDKSPAPSPGLPLSEGVHFTWNCDDEIMSSTIPGAHLSELPEKVIFAI